MIALTIILVLTVIGSFILFGLSAKNISGRYREEEHRKHLFKKLQFIVPLILIVLLGMSLFFGSMNIVDQTEVGVVKTWGQVTGQLNPGVSFINPWVDSLTKYDTKVRSKDLTFASYTKDAQAIDVIVEVQYELPRENAMSVVSQFGNYDALEGKIGNVTEERIKVVLSQLSAMSLMETRSELSTNAMAEVQELEGTFFINFVSVIVKDVSFSDAFEQSVEQKMTAEQAALKAEQDKKTAIINAEKDKEVAALRAEQEVLVAQGEAEAMRIKKDALSSMPDAYIQQLYLEKWDGKLPQIVTEGSGLMIAPDLEEGAPTADPSSD